MLGESRRGRLITGIRYEYFEGPLRAGIVDSKMWREFLAQWVVRRRLEDEFRNAR